MFVRLLILLNLVFLGCAHHKLDGCNCHHKSGEQSHKVCDCGCKQSPCQCDAEKGCRLNH